MKHVLGQHGQSSDTAGAQYYHKAGQLMENML